MCCFPPLLAAQDFSLLHQYRHSFFAVDHESIWMGDESGLFQIDKRDGTLCAFYNASNVPALGYIQSIGVDRRGQLYVCADELLRFAAGEWISVAPTCDGNGGIAFDEEERPLPFVAHRYDAPLNCTDADRVSRGYYQLHLAPDGHSYLTHEAYSCRGGSSGCGCVQQYWGLYRTDGGELRAYNPDEPQLLRTANFAVDRTGRIWTKYYPANALRYLREPTGNVQELAWQADALRQTQLLGFDVQDRLWLLGDTVLYHFVGDSLRRVGPTGFGPIDRRWQLDEAASLYFVASDGRIGHYADSLRWLNPNLPFTEPFQHLSAHPQNGDHWLSAGTELWRISDRDYEVFNRHNSPLPVASPRWGKANARGDLLLYYPLPSDTLLWYKTPTDWRGYDAANWPLSFRHIAAVETDPSGTFWLFNARPEGDTLARFDGTQWQSYPNLDPYWQAIGYHPQPSLLVWQLVGSEFQRIENGDTTRFPIPDSLLTGEEYFTAFTQSGYAWYFTSDPIRLRWFDGQAWRGSDEPFALDGGLVHARPAGDSVWLFTEPPWDLRDALPRAILLRQAERVADYPIASVHPLRFIGDARFSIPKVDREGHLWVAVSTHRYATDRHVTPRYWIQDFYRLDATGPLDIHALLGEPRARQVTQRYWDENDQLWLGGPDFLATLDTLAPLPVLYHKDGRCSESTRLVAANIQGGLGPFAFAWQDGATDPIRWSVPPGDYALTLTDARGNRAEASARTTGELALLVDATVQLPDELVWGRIAVTVSGGTPPYQVEWEDGSSELLREQLPPGTYELRVVDARACSERRTWDLWRPLGATLVSRRSPRCTGVADGQLAWRATGGLPPYRYDWSDGASGAERTDLAAGDYELTISSAAGDSLRQLVSLRNSLELELVGDWIPWGEQIRLWAVPSGGLPPYRWEWDNGATTDTIVRAAAERIGVRVVDAVGCTVETEIEVLLTATQEPAAGGPEVFPNPSTGQLRLRWPGVPGGWRWELWGMDQRLWRWGRVAAGQSEVGLDGSALPGGVYYLRCWDGKKVGTIKWGKY
ncbi:MAG: SprB repeat-containing protein [Bacteroidota bacterium]